MRVQESLKVARKRARGFRRAVKLGDAKSASDLGKATAQYFWNYNTVEAVLLGCAVLVNLAGVMFESGRFDAEYAEYYQGQRTALTWLTLTVIAFAVSYFMLVFVSEILATVNPNWSCFGGQKKGRKSQAADQMSAIEMGSSKMGGGPLGGVADDGPGDYVSNPMFLGSGKVADRGRSESRLAEKAEHVSTVAAMTAETRSLKAEVERLRGSQRKVSQVAIVCVCVRERDRERVDVLWHVVWQAHDCYDLTYTVVSITFPL
jgi:hypothetical protein